MKTMEESDRYHYPALTPASIVIDAGSYEGNWAKLLWRQHPCRIFCFEPIKAFARNIQDHLAPEMTGAITVINQAVGAFGRFETFHVQNDSTGMFATSDVQELVEVVALGPIIESWGTVALLKLNVEGSEYEILEALIAQEIIGRVENLQVQFHRIAGAEYLHEQITTELRKTHELVYDAPWCWEGWSLKK